MPTAPMHPCGHHRCAALVPRGRTHCDEHLQSQQPTAERVASQALYGSDWKKARTRYLSEHPLCVRCSAAGRITAAMVVDHIVAHKGDEVLFWDEANWQSLCDYRSEWNCHGTKTSHESNAAKYKVAARG